MHSQTELARKLTVLASTLSFDGLRLTRLLGCGDFGCVFSTTQPGIVVKLGSQWSEYAFAKEILDRGLNHPALPKIYDIYPFDSGPFDVPLYVLIREDLLDLSSDMSQISSWLDERLADLDFSLERCASEDDVYDLATQILEESPGSLPQERVFEQIVELAAWCLERGVILGDILAINFGQTPGGQIKLRDLGGARIRKT